MQQQINKLISPLQELLKSISSRFSFTTSNSSDTFRSTEPIHHHYPANHVIIRATFKYSRLFTKPRTFRTGVSFTRSSYLCEQFPILSCFSRVDLSPLFEATRIRCSLVKILQLFRVA